jgi:AcrR family transcriptional regulator
MLSTVSPKTADPALRSALIDEAARMIAEQGSEGLSLRRLAGAVGTSTMAIYTHFGSMDEVRRAVRREGFARLAIYLAAVEQTDDPVADLNLLGQAYFANAMANTNLYRAMFMDFPEGTAELDGGIETFERLVAGVDRCLQTGRFVSSSGATPVALATQLWALAHGIVTLHLAGFLSTDQAMETFAMAAANLYVAFGDDPGRAHRSMSRAQRRSHP